MASQLILTAMASIDQVIQQIRFALENLSDRNGQHEFEHLCRHFARHRICFNILPATGPVGGGGDQGRDFETFRSFIYSLGNDKFAALAEQKKLAFACSLQKDVVKKIRADVKTIMGGSRKPDIIYFFSSRSLAVAARHKVQSWAQKTHRVELDIIDAEALAEQLSDAEVFWIAARYLNVPLEIFPPLPDADDEYKAKKDAWTRPLNAPSRYSDFVELKRCARYSLNNSPQDIPFWSSLIAQFEKSQVGESVWTQAAYELIVLTVRQTRSLRGQEDRIRQYFAEAKNFQHPDEVENTATIMAYVVATRRMGEIEIDDDEIHQQWLQLCNKIENGIKNPTSPNQLCFWLEVRGHISFAGGIIKETWPNITETLSWWLRVAEQCPKAPTFPVQEFHDQLFDYMELIGERSEFDRILAKLRPEIAKRAGDAALAESHFKRAEQFSKQKQYVRAIREAEELKRIRIRYDVTLRGLKFTLQRLRGNSAFQSVVAKLRGKGWKDWHVLQAMLNVVANYRTTEKVGRFAGQAEFMKIFKEESFSEERTDSLPVPHEEFSEVRLEFATFTVVLSTMRQHWNLEPKQGTPNLEGLRQYLRHRWRYWDLDVEHSPVFDFANDGAPK